MRRFAARALAAPALLLTLALPALGQKLPTDARLRSTVDSLARAFVAASGAPGVSVQVVRGGDTIVKAGYGLADLEQKVPASAETVYRIGSITKQFASASLMRLVEQKKLALDDSVGAYLPTLPASWRPVTIRQLLNHTSGIPSYTDTGERWRRRWGEPMSTDTLVAITARDSMWFAPGTRWRYDNTGYVVVGMLLDKLTGQPFPQYVEQQLVRPLGLQHTWYCDDERVIPGRARGYERVPDGWRNATYLSMTQPYSAGALCSTVGDLARWNALLANGRVVSAESYRAMTTPQGAAAGSHYGFGLSEGSLAGHRMIRHGGGINGFITDNAYFPAESLSVTVLTNSGSARPGPLLENIVRAAFGVPLDKGLVRVSLTAEQRRPYAGRYELHTPDGQVMVITVIAGANALMAQGEGQPAFELIPLGGHVFGAQMDPSMRVTFALENGKATGFTLAQGGATSQAKRVEAP
ncbi:MAG TPA: serine hydrolase domain-containing protein [Longimicrobiales bacterium]